MRYVFIGYFYYGGFEMFEVNFVRSQHLQCLENCVIYLIWFVVKNNEYIAEIDLFI